jgi:hypothetical protein
MSFLIKTRINNRKASCGCYIKYKEKYLCKIGDGSTSFCCKCGKKYLVKRIAKLKKQAIDLNYIRLKLL